MMEKGRYLIVANLTAESPTLQERVQEILASDPRAEFVVLVPTRPVPGILTLIGVLDFRTVPLARRRAVRARRRLEAAGARVTAVRLSLHKPIEAIEDELRCERYDGVIISTLPHPVSRWLHRDLPREVTRRHPELSVFHVVAQGPLYEDRIGPDAGSVSIN